MALRGEPGALIDACIHLYKHREQNMYSSVLVYKQQCSYLHDCLKSLYRYVFHENWDINSSGLK